MNTDDKRFDKLTEAIIGAAFHVHNTLGSGFMEKVYENAIAHELRKQSLHVEQQVPLKVVYDGVTVGEYVVDLIVERCILVELKVAKAIDDVFIAQCINYLAATGFPLCLLLNFWRKVEVRRIAGRSLS